MKTPKQFIVNRAEYQQHKSAIHAALMYMMRTGCDSTTGLKYAGSKIGIPDGIEMNKFVTYGKKVIFKLYQI